MQSIESWPRGSAEGRDGDCGARKLASRASPRSLAPAKRLLDAITYDLLLQLRQHARTEISERTWILPSSRAYGVARAAIRPQNHPLTTAV
jgi:hypothetical protein